MTRMRRLGTTFALACAVFMALPACTQVEASIDCDAICDYIADCYDTDVDKSQCHSKCSSALDDPDLKRQADSCEACLDDYESCSDKDTNCGCSDVRNSF